jgi:hypothetical protein
MWRQARQVERLAVLTPREDVQPSHPGSKYFLTALQIVFLPKTKPEYAVSGIRKEFSEFQTCEELRDAEMQRWRCQWRPACFR